MFINNNINVQDDRLMNGLHPMLSIMSQIEQAGHEEVVIDFIDNITEHSDTDRGFIVAQAYPTKGYLDICIADRGILYWGVTKNCKTMKLKEI